MGEANSLSQAKLISIANTVKFCVTNSQTKTVKTGPAV